MYVLPLTTTQLAACTPQDVDLTLVDENLEYLEYKPADLVGISVMTSQFSRAIEISREYRKRGAKVVWGGIHPTLVNQEDNGDIDAYVQGEGEEAWPQLLEDFKQGRLKRRYQGARADLTRIPLPRRDFVQINGIEAIIEGVLASRGCIYDCDFCSAHSVYGDKVRMAPLDRVEQDVRNMRSNLGAFCDDNVMNNRIYARELFARIAKYGKKWFAELDPRSAMSEEVPGLLARAGVKIVLIGFESANPANFVGDPKYVTPDRWGAAIGNFHRHGIAVDGNFVLGFDQDTRETFDLTDQAITRSGMDFATFSVLTPYPGTRVRARLEMEGRIFDNSWDNYTLSRAVFTPRNMRPEELDLGVKRLKDKQALYYTFLRNILSA
jgi:radical SAM superfamily enzyme YgiQ (UPF0313 family)